MQGVRARERLQVLLHACLYPQWMGITQLVKHEVEDVPPFQPGGLCDPCMRKRHETVLSAKLVSTRNVLTYLGQLLQRPRTQRRD